MPHGVLQGPTPSELFSGGFRKTGVGKTSIVCPDLEVAGWENECSLVKSHGLIYFCFYYFYITEWVGGTMIRNKVFGSSAPRAVFVFGGSGSPYLPKYPGVVGGQAPTVGSRPRRWLPNAYG